MDSKLKLLKVVELKAILSKANVSCPTKANKQEIIARIIASQLATQIYHQLYPEKSVSSLYSILLLSLTSPSPEKLSIHLLQYSLVPLPTLPQSYPYL